MKIWAKTVLGEKLTRNIIYQCDVVSDEDAFVSALQENLRTNGHSHPHFHEGEL